MKIRVHFILIILMPLLAQCSVDVADATKDSAESTEIPVVTLNHPRSLFPHLRGQGFEEISLTLNERWIKKKNDYPSTYDPCTSNQLLHALSCFYLSPSDPHFQKLLELAQKYYIVHAEPAQYAGGAWPVALAYDALKAHGLSESLAAQFEAKFRAAQADSLAVLNGHSASLWHNRASIIANAMTVAVILGQNTEQDRKQFAAVWLHYQDLIKAIELTQAWPEGYNYWIQSRALPFALSLLAIESGLASSDNTQHIKRVMCDHLSWPLWAMRPDGKVQPLGDEGSRIDLAEQTRPVIDLAALVCDPNVFVRFSDYLTHIKPRNHYHYEYYWIYSLTRRTPADYETYSANQLTPFEPLLAKYKVHGSGAMNQIYYRTHWDESAPFLTFRAGHQFSHHGHYDAGHVSYYHHAPLLVDAARYSTVQSENRLNFSIRTIAKNSVLVLRPNEIVKPNRFFKNNVSDGGQRIVQPTGSAIKSTSHWKTLTQANMPLRGGKLLSTDETPDYFWVHSDITEAYNHPGLDENNDGGKIKQLHRSLLFLPRLHYLFIFDLGHLANAHYPMKSLLHTIQRPEIAKLVWIAGTAEDGVGETTQKSFGIKAYNARASVQALLPLDAMWRVVGGEHYRFHVEADGDDTRLSGNLFPADGKPQPWLDAPSWRLELKAQSPGIRQQHLIALRSDKDQFPPNDAQLLMHGEYYFLVNVESLLWLHVYDPRAQGTMTMPTQLATHKGDILITGLSPDQEFIVAQEPVRANEQGVYWRADTATPSTSQHP